MRLTADDRQSMDAVIQTAIERYLSERGHHAKVQGLAREVAQRDADLLDRLAE
jgi:hypothetical protein